MATTARLTLEQFLALPDTEPASEYVCGEVIQKAMPDEPRGVIQLYLGSLLLTCLSQHPIARVRSEWRCVFGPVGNRRAWVPDLIVVTNEHYPAGPPRAHPFLETAPDLAIEILSPDQNARRFAEKIDFYLRHGVRLVWVIDPIERVITVFCPDRDNRELASGDTLDGEDVLPGFSVVVGEIFAQLES